jgi:serine/threonine protein kinase
VLNDKQASELISKSLRHQLNQDEEDAINQHLEQNEESQKFANVSKLIQQSVSEIATRAEAGDESIAPGLSADAKKRLRSSVVDAVLRRSQTGTKGTPAQARTLIRDSSSSSGVGSDPEVRSANSRYHIARKLGEGGLGTVWLARDEKLRRTVAIKEMNPMAMESPVARHRFHREAQITGYLEHPGIVSLYQFGIDSVTQQPFYSMRFVGKRTLADAIIEHHERRETGDAGLLCLHRLLGDFLRICQAIAYAHSRGVIHRDLKPENIAIDNFGQVIVLDWGLAKVLDTAELGTQLVLRDDIQDSELAQTMAGEAIGTPLYMSPEQAAGKHDEIDERTDIYGLGAILFAILTGCAPHEKTAKSSDTSDRIEMVLESIANAETPRPSSYSEGIPRVLEKVCVKAMARRQYARFESATELADAIERWMAGQSDRAARYENLRMEGRELKNDFQSGVDDLESNVRFASLLPPIQELIRPESEEDDIVWRERLATIFIGLMRAKPAFTGIVFNRVENGQFTELVRVERHSRDHSTVRKIPRSLLRSEATNKFVQQILTQPPEEVLSSLVCDPFCERDDRCEAPQLVAGLPVYDDQTEKPFGVLMIVCDLDTIFDKQMRRPGIAGEILVACDTFHTLMHSRGDRLVDASKSRPVAEIAPEFDEAIKALQNNAEYIDETDRKLYGVRLWLMEKVHGLIYLLSLHDE